VKIIEDPAFALARTVGIDKPGTEGDAGLLKPAFS
jgi:hypothetical protein